MRIDITDAIANIFSGRKLKAPPWWWAPSAMKNLISKYAKYEQSTEYITDIKDLSNVMKKYEEVMPQIWKTSKDGEAHSYDDLPAYVSYYQDGTLWGLSWFKDGKKHRDGDEPASITYNSDGYINHVYYYKDGVLHRDDKKPADIRFDRNGKVRDAEWFSHGTRYKIMRYNKYGNIDR